MRKQNLPGALSNLRVLDITHVLAGPYCSYQLALLGADVIKVEPVTSPDCARGRGPDSALNNQGLGLNYQVQGANKRAISVDLAQPEGKEILRELAKNADILVENFTTGSLAKLGLGAKDLCALNPQLIYCSLTGYGDSGPMAQTGAYDNTIQAGSGIIDQSAGHKPGVSFIDYTSGMSAAFAILAAVNQRTQTGEGCAISLSMFEVAMSMMAPEAAAIQHATSSGNEPVSRGKEAGISSYPTKQGQLMLGAFTPQQYRRLGVLLDRLGHKVPALHDIQTWDDVWHHSARLVPELSAIFASRTCDVWVELLRAQDLPCDRIKPLSEAVTAPQIQSRGYFAANPTNPAVTLPLSPFQMSTGGGTITKAPPRHGEDTVEILSELGHDATAIDHMRKRGIIA